MKKLSVVLIALMLATSAPAWAGQVAHVSVNGLVCDFCARTLEKLFKKEGAVNDITVDLDSKLVTIDFQDGQTIDDETITKIVTDAGYNVDKIHRMDVKETPHD